MGFFKKTILLSNQSNYNGGMAILSIEKTGAGVFASLKTFDIDKDNNLILGISVDGKEVIKQSVVFANSNIFNFKLSNDFDCDGKIACVLVRKENNTIKPIIWGTNGHFAEYKNDIIKVISKECELIDSVNAAALINLELSEEDKSINAQTNNEKVDDLFETSEEEIEEIIDNELDGRFYSIIGDQLEELFNNSQLEENLMQIVPNSKWVKINYDENEKDYVLGLIYEDGQVKYICYGVPSDIDTVPPEKLQSYSQWLSVDGVNGYWVMFQDAKTGENIVVDDANLS